MQNFKIEIEDSIYYVIYEGVDVGSIEHDKNENLYYVYPTGATYSATFVHFEEAIIELIFHVYLKKFDRVCAC